MLTNGETTNHTDATVREYAGDLSAVALAKAEAGRDFSLPELSALGDSVVNALS